MSDKKQVVIKWELLIYYYYGGSMKHYEVSFAKMYSDSMSRWRM